MALECPACAARLVELEVASAPEGEEAPPPAGEDEGLPIDVCVCCGGLWLDGGELERRGASVPAGFSAAAGTRRCPRCACALAVRSREEQPEPLHLDECPACGGVWFDEGEMERLAGTGGPPGAEAERAVAFRCERCFGTFPLCDQVLGEAETLCPDCAGLTEARHEPSARQGRPAGGEASMDWLFGRTAFEGHEGLRHARHASEADRLQADPIQAAVQGALEALGGGRGR